MSERTLVRPTGPCPCRSGSVATGLQRLSAAQLAGPSHATGIRAGGGCPLGGSKGRRIEQQPPTGVEHCQDSPKVLCSHMGQVTMSLAPPVVTVGADAAFATDADASSVTAIWKISSDLGTIPSTAASLAQTGRVRVERWPPQKRCDLALSFCTPQC